MSNFEVVEDVEDCPNDLLSLRVCLIDLDEDSRNSVFEDDIEEISVPKDSEKDDEEKNNDNFFEVLPDEIITKILSYLTLKDLCQVVAPVCKDWLSYSRNPLLWQRLPFEEIGSLCPKHLVTLIQSKCPLLKELNLKCQNELSLYDYQVIAQSCPLLEKLSLAFCTQVNKQIISSFVKYCLNLQDLNIEGCEVNDDALFLLQSIPLRRLNASHCTHLSDNGIVFIAKHCPHIREINIDGVQWISHEAVAVLIDSCYDNLCNVWLDGENLCDDSMRVLARCRNLRTLSLSFCNLLTDDALRWIQEMRRLKYLRLKKGQEFSAYALTELFQELHHSKMNDGTGLLHLDLPECTEVNDVVLTTVAKSCPNLVAIDLSWCWEVTDLGLEQLVVHCEKLENVCLIGLYKLLGEPLKQACKQLPKLKTLDARQCNRISDELLDELASQMIKTTILNYYGEEVKHPAWKLSNLGVGRKLCW